MCKSKHFLLLIAAVTLSSKTTYAYPEDDQKTEKAKTPVLKKSQSKNTLKIVLFTVGIISVAFILGTVISHLGNSDPKNDESDPKDDSGSDEEKNDESDPKDDSESDEEKGEEIKINEYWKKFTQEIDGEEVEIYKFDLTLSGPKNKDLSTGEYWKNALKSLGNILNKKGTDYTYGLSFRIVTTNINIFDINLLKNLPKKSNVKSFEFSSIISGNIFHIIESFPSLVKLEIENTISCSAKSLDFIKPLEKIKFLTLHGFEQVTDITPIGDKTDLRSLMLWSFEVSDLTPLKSLVNLETLFLEQMNSKKEVFPPFEKLTKLKKLKMESYKKDEKKTLTRAKKLPDSIKKLINLEELELVNFHDLEDLKPLESFYKTLGVLKLSSSPKAKNLSVIGKLVQLNELYLNNIALKDLSLLSRLKNLQILTLIDLANVKDFSQVGNLVKLNNLHVDNIVGLKDISFLKNLENLKKLTLIRLPQVRKEYHYGLLLMDKIKQKKESGVASIPPPEEYKEFLWTPKDDNDLEAAKDKVAEIQKNKLLQLEDLMLDLPLAYCLAKKADLAAFLELPKLKKMTLSLEEQKPDKQNLKKKFLKKMKDYDLKESKYVEAFKNKKIQLASCTSY
ncbi:MAG: hypothetical protein AAF335_01410 [Bacteroidota bacterium]